MTREEAIKRIKARFDKLALDDKDIEAIQTLIPELRESEDEKIRKALVWHLKADVDFVSNGVTKAECIAYLEKQKDASKAIEAVYRIDKYIDEHVVNAHDMKDSNPDKKYYLGWDYALAKMSGILQDVYSDEKQKEQDECPEFCVRSHCMGCPIYEKKQKEWKPILEVFGFKVGDAVRLKDGDGRKHIIKSFEEIKGLHGPNFYHVEFEDNSATDSIYPGEEYPNGYYTQMEKFEEKQKPAEKNITNEEITAWNDKSLTDVVITELGKYNGENYWKSPWAIDSTGLQYPLYFANLGATWQKKQKPILKFKVGDKIHLIDGTSPNYEDDCITIREIDTINYIGEFKEGYVPIKEQDKWELVKKQKLAEYADDVIEEAEEYTSKIACGEYGVEVTEAYIAGVLSERNRGTGWSEFDIGVLKDAICATDTLGNDESFNKSNPNLAKAFRVAKDWLKSLPERLNLQPKQE